MTIIEALFLCFVTGFGIIGIALIICEDHKRKWIAEDKQKERTRKSQELFEVRMNRLRRENGEEWGIIMENKKLSAGKADCNYNSQKIKKEVNQWH